MFARSFLYWFCQLSWMWSLLQDFPWGFPETSFNVLCNQKLQFPQEGGVTIWLTHIDVKVEMSHCWNWEKVLLRQQTDCWEVFSKKEEWHKLLYGKKASVISCIVIFCCEMLKQHWMVIGSLKTHNMLQDSMLASLFTMHHVLLDMVIWYDYSCQTIQIS